MAKPDTNQTANTATTADAPAQVLPPVPGGGSWRPNAAGDGWVENLPEPAAPEATTETNSSSLPSPLE